MMLFISLIKRKVIMTQWLTKAETAKGCHSRVTAQCGSHIKLHSLDPTGFTFVAAPRGAGKLWFYSAR